MRIMIKIRSLAIALAIVSTGVLAAPASAQQFTLQIGPPAAAMPDPLGGDPKKPKDVTFVVRSTGCADPRAFRVVAKAETVEGGARRSVELRSALLPQPGVFAVFAPVSGVRVVSVAATCGTSVAGAIVSLVDGKYRRDGVELLSQHPAEADVARALARGTAGSRQR